MRTDIDTVYSYGRKTYLIVNGMCLSLNVVLVLDGAENRYPLDAVE